MDIILRLKKVRRFTRPALLPVLLFFAAEIGAQAQTQDYSMSVGDDFGAVVDANGNLFVWGAIATEVAPGEIQQILPPEQWREVSVSRTPAASAHVLAIQKDGTLWAWGSNTRGQLGNGTTADRVDPVQISTAIDWVEIAAGEFHSMARKSTGLLFVWGGNSYGQLGIGPISNDPDLDIRKSIQAPFDANPYIAIAAGKAHSHAIRSDGTLWTWGSGNSATNGGSELGILVNGAPPIGVVAPTQVGTAAGWSDLFGGYNATFALRNTATQTGQLWVWGSGLNLGTGNGLERTPARVGSGVGWVDISVASTSSSAHTLGLKGDKLYGWGLNYEGGQLGLPLYDGQGSFLIANIKKDLPTALEVSDRFLAIGAGEEFSAVVDADGFLLTAGINDVGQLANGQTDPSLPGQDFFANSNLGVADLQGEGVTINTQQPWTLPSVSASFSMKNGGTGEIDDEFNISAVLSPNTNYDTESAIQLEFAPGKTELLVTDPLAAGQSLSVPFSFLLPDSVVRGNYYLVVKADSFNNLEPSNEDGLIVETDEDNNAAATLESFEFYPDLIVKSLAVVGGSFESGDPLTINVELENQGIGTITAGSQFELRLFLSPDKTPDNSAAVDLDADIADTLVTVYTVELASDLNSTNVIALDFDLEVPRMSGGFYYVGAFVDVIHEVEEQTEIVINNVVAREDGEDNNLTFTATAVVEVTGIDIPISIDQELLTFTITGDGDWFGQNFVFNGAVVGNDDAVQSPPLAVGDWAAFSTDLDFGAGEKPYAITFNWKSETSSIDNKLIYRAVNGATGGLFNEISGITGWTTVQRVVPANARAEWVYEKGTEANGDAVYVDNLQVTEVTLPDLVIDDIYLPDGASGSYVLLRDKLDLTVNSRNQGTDTDADDDYVISIYLSKDRTFDRPDSNPATADDTLIRQEMISGGIGSGDPAVNGFSILLDAALDDGNYYVIGYIDDYTDLDPTGQVSEFADVAISFDGEANNLFVSSGTIEIVALPDLIVSELNANPNYYLIEDPVTGEANSMEFDFTVANIGLTAVNTNVATQVLFSDDEVIEPESDYLLLDYNYNGNFGALVDAPANERLISPDAIDFREDLIDAGYIGRRLFVGVYIDSDLVVEELDEDHNSSYLLNNDFILSELPIVQGLDLNDATITAQNITVINDESASYDSLQVPWVGQTTESVDGVDAVTNVIVGDNETSQFSLTIEPTTGIRLSFWWKVSSEYTLGDGGIQVDTLNFEVDGFEAVAPIFGTEDEEWRRVELSLEPGPHTLTWSYVKDDQGSDGEDRGWVDNLVIEELPNLTVTGVTANGLPVYAAGDTIDTWSVTIKNKGAGIEAGTTFDVPVRLLPQGNWSESAAVIELLMITDPNTAGLAAGETRTYDATLDLGSGALGVLTIPDVDYAQDFYYFGAYVDWSAGDPANGQISESNESDNNSLTDEASIQIGLPDLTGDSSSITGLNPSYVFGDSVDINLTFTNSGDGSLAVGSDFNYTVYIAQINDDLLLDTASVVELGTGTATVATEVASGADLNPANLVATLPFGLAEGNYYLGVKIDVNTEVEEQGLRPDGTGVNGEANNLFFSQIAVFQVTGISLQTALDDATSPIALGTFENVLDSAAFWFGRDDAGNTPVDDDQTFLENEGAQSPALNQGDEASFQLLVPVSSLVKFDWAIFSGSDLNVLSVLVDGVVIDSISGNEPFAEVDPGILVPDNGIIEWRYSQGAAMQGDFAVIDNVRVETNSQPDLIVSAINYTPGEYVLDVAGIAGAPNQLLGTEYLDITVEATNQGVDVIATVTAFSSADLEIRLSIDRIYGNVDDIVLGTVSQVEGNFDSGNLMRFIGPVQLGDSIPEGCYYLIAKIDTNDALAEFSEANNILVAENRDVCIKRLPALRIYNPNAYVLAESLDGVNNYLDPRDSGVVAFDLDEDLQYYSEAPMRLRFGIQNVGLGRVTGRETWTTKVSLLGALREDLGLSQLFETEAEFVLELNESFGVSIELGDFTIQELMEGRSEAKPDGDILYLDLDLALPSGARLNGIIQGFEEDSVLDDYLWIISIDLDSTDAVQQSQIIRESPAFVAPAGNPWWIIDLNEARSTDISAPNTTDDDGLFGIKFQPLTVSEADWELLYGVTADAAGTDEEIANFLAYAFNRNPADLDTEAGQLPITFGLTEFEGLDYQYVAFDIVTRSTDLIYTVQADNNEAFNSPETMVTIKGPFDQLTGMDSLTGEGGLIDKVNVTSVLDQGYTARVTVKDTVDAEPGTIRYLRIVVSVDPDPQGTPVDSFPAVAISESPEGSIVYEPIEWDGPAPVDPVDTLPAALSEAVSLGSSWYYLDWFGYFAYDSASAASWAYSLDLGWIYIASSGSTEQFWFWSDSLSTWLWASKTYPSYFYHWNYSSWAYVQSKSGGGAWLNRISTGIWEEVTP